VSLSLTAFSIAVKLSFTSEALVVSPLEKSLGMVKSEALAKGALANRVLPISAINVAL
jgi:hypothetical protein